jgi:hypothetical protein
MRFGRNSGQTGIGDVYVGNTFESIDTKRFAGQTVTLSFYVKAGANAPLTLSSQIRTGTGTDQAASTLFSTGWTGGANNSQSNTVTTTMTRYTQTVTLGSTVNQIMIAFAYTPTGTAGANEWFQIEGVQLEIASAASAFSRNAGTIQGELSACQRYYWRATAGSLFQAFASGQAKATTSAFYTLINPVFMRVAPTSIDFSTLALLNGSGATAGAATTVTLSYPGAQASLIDVAIASGLTAGDGSQLVANNSTSAFIGVSAEL